MALSPEELALLTDEEREAYEEEGDENDDDSNDEGGDNNANDDDAGDDKGDDDKGAQDDDAAPGRDDGQDDDKGGQEEPTQARVNPAPLFNAELPEDVQGKLDAIEAERNKLSERFDDGELTSKEFMAESRKLDRQESELDWQVRKAQLAEETVRAQQENSWFANVQDFAKAHPELRKDEETWNSFDPFVRFITANPANQGLTDQQQLDKAYALWKADRGETVEPAKPGPKKDEKPSNAKPPREVPPLLGKVPAADANDIEDGKYAHLDRLASSDPLAYEAALAKMPQHEVDAYMQSN